MDIKAGDVLKGSYCDWEVGSFLGCGTCSQVFQARSVVSVCPGSECCLSDPVWNADYGRTVAIKVFKEGKNYESTARREVEIQKDLEKDVEAVTDGVGGKLARAVIITRSAAECCQK